ncbi:MAG: GGDEF domain-containing protein [Spirochaetales bacterium]|nr:GGDEF domain-containing protein [Spirochaetales bacterium]
MSYRMKRSRYTLGFQINNLYGGYAEQLWPGINDAVREKGWNLMVFPGRTPKAPYGFEYQSSVIYDFIKPSNIDALVSAAGTLINFFKPEETRSFYEKFQDIPVVTLSIKIPGIPAVLIDNTKGLIDLVRHLIRDHQCRNFVLIGGPESNMEAEERCRACMKVFEEERIPLDKDRVYRGDFNIENGKQATLAFLSKYGKKIDAIVAANDDMAFGAMEIMKSRGIRVPEDIKVIGFDDVKQARLVSPKLSTVHQPIYLQAKMAADMGMEMAEKGMVLPDVYLPTEMVVRASCGCSVDKALILPWVHEVKYLDLEREKRQRKRIKKAVMRKIITFVNILDYQREELSFYLGNMRKVMDIVLSDHISEQDIMVFLSTMREILKNEYNHGRRINIWLDYIPEILNIVFTKILEPQKQQIIRKLFDNVQSIISDMVQAEDAQAKFELIEKFIVIRTLIASFSSTVDIKEMIRAISREFLRIGCRNLYIVMFEDIQLYEINGQWRLPRQALLYLAIKDRVKINLDDDPCLFPAEGMLPAELFPTEKPFCMAICQLFYMEEQLGYIIFEISEGEREIYDIIVAQISMAFKNSLLFKSFKENEKILVNTMHALKEHNIVLQDISRKDELTGLYNRRGFMTAAEENLELAGRMEKGGALFFADLDRLKYINDTFGHDEGDFAIKTCAKILTRIFRHADIIGRIGGDEFIIFTVDMDVAGVEKIAARLKEQITLVNQEIQKPYQVSISIGWSVFTDKSIKDMKTLIQEADDMLYTRKKRGKQL